MSPRARAIVGVIIMSSALVLYFVLVGVRAVALLSSGTWIAALMGAALLVLPLLGVWALWREVSFGWRSTVLIDELDAQHLLPDDLGEQTARGKADRDTANAVFERYRAETEAEPSNWQNWARLGIVYDACGDRKRGRAALREAISLRRGE